MTIPVLSIVLFLPLAGALLVSLVPKDYVKLMRLVALASSIVAFGASLWMLFLFNSADGGFQLVEKVEWISRYRASYHLGVDGISLWLVLLTTFLVPLCIAASWRVDKKVKALNVILLLMETSILGVFLSLDLLLFYIFWEGMLIPMYFLIGVWGYERRVYAALKFFLYTLFGSLLMLVGVAALYFLGGRTFDLAELSRSGLGPSAQLWLFGAFFASFAIKVPIFPFHTWLPDAHTEAPTAGSVLLAGVLLKMGGYGFLRLSIPLFPDATVKFAPWLAILGVIGIVYGGIVSIVQSDVKRLVAYSSVSHLGFVVLGIAALNTAATTGSVLQMVSHGLSTGLLFLLIGMLYQRAHTRKIADLSGVGGVMPVFGGMFLIAVLSSLGLPGLNGFVGEFLILNGTFPVMRALTIIATLGVVLAAIYLLWMYERVFTGPVKIPHAERKSVWRDVSPGELAVIVPVIAMMLWIGLYPKPFLDRIEPSVERVLSNLNRPVASR
ncbi:MAG TPA: NADH-quinone oxidoreductase subunit M [Actinomycetota bacterium]|nr:NADH-quinone oxidoreductase subunit M [Actinomycetota bacterium]